MLSVSNSNFRCLGLLNRCFRIEGIAKTVLSWKSRLNIELLFCSDALGAVFLIFVGLGNKFENVTMFSKKPDLEKWIWWRILCRGSGFIKT